MKFWYIQSNKGFYTINNDWSKVFDKNVKRWESLHLCQAAKSFWDLKGDIIEGEYKQ